MKGRTRWWVEVLRMPVVVVSAIGAPLYRICFGWLDRRQARKNEQRLAQEVRSAFGFLFIEQQAQIIPNEGVRFPPSFDYAFVTVATPKFLLRLGRGRGEVGAFVAPLSARKEWHDLSLVVAASQGHELQRSAFRNIQHVAKVVRPNVQTLGECLSPEQYRELKQRLRLEVYVQEEFARRQWETEINSRLYGPR
jgi:hypothetical protein